MSGEIDNRVGRSGGGEATAEFMLEVAQWFFRIRAFGQRAGLITGWGGGAFGFMRSLALRGPLSVPEIARMRPTSRQRMQRLADELAGKGLVEFIDNPRHRRSRLVRLTQIGEADYCEMNRVLLSMATLLSADLPEGDVQKATETVRALADAIARLNGTSGLEAAPESECVGLVDADSTDVS